MYLSSKEVQFRITQFENFRSQWMMLKLGYGIRLIVRNENKQTFIFPNTFY